ncbi:hypothetical protein [Cryobacterium melibiosiphilum]|nr:hypothetical protein [Cryobacterium melibiosiphilum]
MFVLIAVIVIVALTSLTALVGEVSRDGYRQLPERNLVRAF